MDEWPDISHNVAHESDRTHASSLECLMEFDIRIIFLRVLSHSNESRGQIVMVTKTGIKAGKFKGTDKV